MKASILVGAILACTLSASIASAQQEPEQMIGFMPNK